MSSILNSLGRDEPTTALAYFTGMILVILSVAMSFALSDILLDRNPYLLSIAAVAISAWYGGGKAGILAAILSLVLVNFLLIEPRFTFTVDAPKIVSSLLFLFVTLFISWTEMHRKRTKEALREANDELKIILDGVADGITMQGEDGQPIFSNQAAATLTGYRTSAELIADSAEGRAARFALLDENDAPVPASARPRTQVFQTGKPAAMTLKLRFNNTGEYRWIHLKSAPVFNHRRRAKAIVNILQDITPLKKRELENAQATQITEATNRRINRLIAHVPSMVYEGVIDPATGAQRLDFINAYAAEIFGYPVERLQEDPQFLTNLIHVDDRKKFEQDVINQLKTSDTARATFRAIRQDEAIINCEAHFTLTRDEMGKPIGTAGIITDISERARYEETLKETAGELRRSNEELEQFAYIASHDLQEPLRMVTSYLQLIEQHYANQLDADANEFIGYAVDGAQRMKILINDLLLYSRVQRAKLVFAPLAMEDAFAQAKYNLQIAIENSEAVITHDPLPQLTANESQIVQLLQNLLANAIKFRQEAPPKIHVSAQRDDENREWVFSVRDNGIGFKSEYSERIFVLFQRLHGRGTHPGTGIGLAICKKIIERHDGRIWVTSTPGEGSTFYFSLPMNLRKNTHGSH